MNKPAGMVVHPAAGHASGTLVNALLHHLTGSERHRRRAAAGHRAPARSRHVRRDGRGQERRGAPGAVAAVPRPRGREGIHRAGLGRRAGRAPHRRRNRPRPRQPAEDVLARQARAATRSRGSLARMHLPGLTLCQVAIHTGRTHQIRVHLSAIGHPVVGDSLYGGVHRRVAGRHPRRAAARAAVPPRRAAGVHAPARRAAAWSSPLRSPTICRTCSTLCRHSTARTDSKGGFQTRPARRAHGSDHGHTDRPA